MPHSRYHPFETVDSCDVSFNYFRAICERVSAFLEYFLRIEVPAPNHLLYSKKERVINFILRDFIK